MTKLPKAITVDIDGTLAFKCARFGLAEAK